MLSLALLLLLLGALYALGSRNFGYWRRRGVRHERPLPFFGNNARNYFMRRSVTQLATELYRKYPGERVVGSFRANRPELLIRDPELARRVLVADFDSFHPRGMLPRGRAPEPLLRNLFFADGDLWRLLRQRTAPAFSGAKLRAMFPLVAERAGRLRERVAGGGRLDARELLARYTTDCIGACGFGLDADSLRDDDSAFRRIGAKIFQIGPAEVCVGALRDMFPALFGGVGTLWRVEKDFRRLVADVLARRGGRPGGRGDFVDLLLESRARGRLEVASLERPGERAALELDDDAVAAQLFVFFAAGFETSSSASSRALHELAQRPAALRRAQAAVDAALARHGGLSYAAVRDMAYLEWALREALRVGPPLGVLQRESARAYRFEALGLSIGAGVRVLVPLQALHTDPQYWDRPDEFRPERHDPARAEPGLRRAFLPFGDGPRACIGERLGLMQSLAGLAAVLSHYDVRPAPDAPRRPAVAPASGVVQSVVGGLPLLFEPRAQPAA